MEGASQLAGGRSGVGSRGETGCCENSTPLWTGFFWEMWNLYAYPKWIHDIPNLEFLRLFQMPLAGYGGYIPSSWELFALVAADDPR